MHVGHEMRAWHRAGVHREEAPIRRVAAAGRSLVGALLLALCIPSPVAARRLQVCTLSFNTPDEVAVFRARLPPDDFEVTDLTPRERPDTITQAVRTGGTPWIANECRSDLRCDVVVISAEFAGRFFGTGEVLLGLQDMEEASCRRSCDGLFHAPREVFLLGCNTLATKDADRRSPAQYLQVLLDHDYERGLAEQIVAQRYGPLGPSFRESVRRVFSGVPRIYGFSSVAPVSARTAPMLRRYFNLQGDYREYLEAAGRSTAQNEKLFAAFRGTPITQAAGITPREPAAADREQICNLYDTHRSVAARLRIVLRLLERDDFLAFLPTIEVFFAAHPIDQLVGEERTLVGGIRRDARARDQVLELVRTLDVSALRLELANLAAQLGWMDQNEFQRLAIHDTHEIVRAPLTLEAVDILCEISKHERIGATLDSASLPDDLFQHAKGLRLLDCLSPPDPRVSARVVGTLQDDDVNTRLWAVYVLSGRLPLDDEVMRRLAPHLGDAAPGVRDRLRRIFVAQAARAPLRDDVSRTVARYDPILADALQARSSPRN
jgi:hypothetical protein